jgi:hypothetical protein
MQSVAAVLKGGDVRIKQPVPTDASHERALRFRPRRILDA